MTGRVVVSKEYVSGLKNGTESFDISTFSAGVYLIKINTSKGIFYKKVSKVN